VNFVGRRVLGFLVGGAADGFDCEMVDQFARISMFKMYVVELRTCNDRIVSRI
jgi:hypothetical protein